VIEKTSVGRLLKILTNPIELTRRLLGIETAILKKSIFKKNLENKLSVYFKAGVIGKNQFWAIIKNKNRCNLNLCSQ
jgi:hypothetical protein